MASLYDFKRGINKIDDDTTDGSIILQFFSIFIFYIHKTIIQFSRHFVDICVIKEENWFSIEIILSFLVSGYRYMEQMIV